MIRFINILAYLCRSIHKRMTIPFYFLLFCFPSISNSPSSIEFDLKCKWMTSVCPQVDTLSPAIYHHRSAGPSGHRSIPTGPIHLHSMAASHSNHKQFIYIYNIIFSAPHSPDNQPYLFIWKNEQQQQLPLNSIYVVFFFFLVIYLRIQ